MSFAAIQAAYAAHRVATYPLTVGKTPAVKAYTRIGAPYSAQLVMKFGDALGAGFYAGPRNRITVIDIDTGDPRLVDEIERMADPSPLHVLTPSGGRHLYYRNGGEPRRIRALPDVDILGAGNVVCAGSKTDKGRYVIERGSLDDLDALPPLAASLAPAAPLGKVPVGRRNEELFKHAHSIVTDCDTLDQLIDAARTWAVNRLAAPLLDAEVIKTCSNVWRWRGGRKLFMDHVIEGPVFATLIANRDLWTLCSYLMIENGPAAEFMIADGLAAARRWPRRMVPEGRRILVEMGIVEMVRAHSIGVPALYRWKMPRAD